MESKLTYLRPSSLNPWWDKLNHLHYLNINNNNNSTKDLWLKCQPLPSSKVSTSKHRIPNFNNNSTQPYPSTCQTSFTVVVVSLSNRFSQRRICMLKKFHILAQKLPLLMRLTPLLSKFKISKIKLLLKAISTVPIIITPITKFNQHRSVRIT